MGLLPSSQGCQSPKRNAGKKVIKGMNYRSLMACPIYPDIVFALAHSRPLLGNCLVRPYLGHSIFFERLETCVPYPSAAVEHAVELVIYTSHEERSGVALYVPNLRTSINCPTQAPKVGRSCSGDRTPFQTHRTCTSERLNRLFPQLPNLHLISRNGGRRHTHADELCAMN